MRGVRRSVRARDLEHNDQKWYYSTGSMLCHRMLWKPYALDSQYCQRAFVWRHVFHISTFFCVCYCYHFLMRTREHKKSQTRYQTQSLIAYLLFRRPGCHECCNPFGHHRHDCWCDRHRRRCRRRLLLRRLRCHLDRSATDGLSMNRSADSHILPACTQRE